MRKKVSPALRGSLDYIAVVGEDLVATGWVYGAHRDSMEFAVLQGDERLELEGLEVLGGSRPDVADHVGDPSRLDWGIVLLGRVPNLEGPPTELTLLISSSEGQCRLKGVPDSSGTLDALERAIAPYRDDERRKVCERVRLTTQLPRNIQAVQLSELPGFVRAHVEWAVPLDQRHVYFHGWLLDGNSEITGIYVRTHLGWTSNLLHRLGSFERPDVVEAFPEHQSRARNCGMVCLASLDGAGLGHAVPALDTSTLELWVRTTDNTIGCASYPLSRVLPSSSELTMPFFSCFRPESQQGLFLLEQHIGPAIETAWSPPRPSSVDSLVEDYGEVPGSAAWAVVVPLYGRCDFLLYQLSQFVFDEDFQDAQLIYVVDDPQLVLKARRLAREIAPLFPVPFRLAYPGRNLGFAGANNYGVELTQSRFVVLLNSDVLPTRSGWLGRMRDAYEQLERPGVLGIRLLFEDGTIQHDGLRFQTRSELPGLYLNDHPGKGFPAHLAPSTPLEEVPAVTAACAMIARETYQDLGGMDPGYIMGDFEDSDLCLAAREKGYRNYILRSETLYHLERQSQSLVEDKTWKHKLTLYNAWRHSQRWRHQLAELAPAGGAK